MIDKNEVSDFFKWIGEYLKITYDHFKLFNLKNKIKIILFLLVVLTATAIFPRTMIVLAIFYIIYNCYQIDKD